MKGLDRFLFIIYFIALTCLFVFVALIPFTSPVDIYNLPALFVTYKWYILLGTILLILFNIRLIIMVAFPSGRKKFAVVKYTSDGEVNISNDTIKSLVTKTVSQVKAVKECKVFIRPNNEKIDILIKAMIMPDINIPQTIKKMQEDVRLYVEMTTEIPVGEVKVHVVDVASGGKLRLE